MKKVLRILFDTAWGAPALLAFVLVLGDLRSIFAAPLSHCGTLCFLLDVSLEVLPVVAGFILLVAFVLSLVRRNWQGLKMLGLVLAVLFGLGALRVPVMLAHERVSQHFSGNAQYSPRAEAPPPSRSGDAASPRRAGLTRGATESRIPQGGRCGILARLFARGNGRQGRRIFFSALNRAGSGW